MVSKYRRQESEYLQGVNSAEADLVTSHVRVGKGSYRQEQFSLSEVIRGGGRAVWAEGDRGEHFREINRAFGLPASNNFSRALRSKVIEFQRSKVNNDPSWRVIEERLKSKGKTLVDGMIGALTLDGLVDSQIVQIDRSKIVAASPIYDSERRKGLEPKREDKKIVVERSNRTSGVIQGSIKREDTQIKEEVEKLSARLSQARSDLTGLGTTLTSLSKGQSQSNIAKFCALHTRFQEEDDGKLPEGRLEVMEGRRMEVRRELFPSYDLISGVKQDFAAQRSLIEQRLNAMSAIEARLDLVQDRLSKASSQKATSEELRQIQRQLTEQVSLISSIDARGYDDLKPRANSSVKVDDAKIAAMTSTLASYFDDLKKCRDAMLPGGDISAMYPIAKSYLLTPDKKWKRYVGKVSSGEPEELNDSTIADFCSAYQSSSFSLKVIQTLDRRYGGHRQGITLGLLSDGNKMRLVNDLEFVVKNNVVQDDKTLQTLASYTKALKWAESVGISNPFRFSTESLIQLMNDDLHPDRTKPLLVVLGAQADWNGALHALSSHIYLFREQGYRVSYREVLTDKDIPRYLSDVTDSGKDKADALIISGHGSSDSISLSARDPRFYRLDEDPSDRRITLQDEMTLRSAGSYIAPGASLLLYSCSNGHGKSSDPDNVANFMRRVFPHLAEKSIFSMTEPGWVDEIIFDKDKKVKKVIFGGEPGVETYQSSISSDDYANHI